METGIRVGGGIDLVSLEAAERVILSIIGSSNAEQVKVIALQTFAGLVKTAPVEYCTFSNIQVVDESNKAGVKLTAEGDNHDD